MEDKIELKSYIDGLQQHLDGYEEHSACYKKLSEILNEKDYKSKLNYGFERGCEQLIKKDYSYIQLRNQLSFFNNIPDDITTGLISEIFQAEAAAIISAGLNHSIRNLLWWGIGEENEFIGIKEWIDLIKEISILESSAPCKFGKIKRLRSASKKTTEIIRLWNYYYECNSLGSKFNVFASKSEALNFIREFSADYPEIKGVYGFSDLIKAIKASGTRSDKVAKDDPIRKKISVIANIISGRAHVIICRAKLDKRKKAEAWITGCTWRKTKQKYPDIIYKKRSRYEILQSALENWREKDFESILEMLFETLISEENPIDDKRKIIEAIRKIYQSQDIPSGIPPWYPDLKEDSYFPNPDIVKCGHFLFILGMLEQGNLKGRWEKESLQYLLKNQSQEGYWSSSTFEFRPDNYATVVAMYALGLWRPEGWKEAIIKAAEWLWEQQRPDGSWSFTGKTNKAILNAIDLADGNFKLSLKQSDKAIEFIDLENGSEPENMLLISENITNKNDFKHSFRINDFSSIQDGFEIKLGQVLWGGRDLNIKTGMAQEILEKLVIHMGAVVSFKELDSESTDYEASIGLRSIISYLRKKLKLLPIEIENRRQSGYIMNTSNHI